MLIQITLIFLISVSQCAADKETLPVFVLDFERTLTTHITMKNPFNKLTKSNFSALVRNAQENSKRIVVFIDNTLMTEDFSLKDSRGTDFPNLQTVLNKGYVLYYPSVVSPYETLKSILEISYQNTLYMGHPERELKDLDKKLKVLYVYFYPKHNMSRINLLRDHDYKIMTTYKLLRQMSNGPIIGFYTGKINPINLNEMNVYRRMTIQNQKEARAFVIVISEWAMYRFSGVSVTAHTHKATYDKRPKVVREVPSEKALESVLSYMDFDLQFMFSYTEKEWKVDSIALLEEGEEVGQTQLSVGAPWDSSYMCSEPIVIINTRDGSIVTISRYQIEPRSPDWKSDPNATAQFSDPVHCGPYFSVAIISALLVAGISVMALLGSATSMINCKSNPKYEDSQTTRNLTIIEN